MEAKLSSLATLTPHQGKEKQKNDSTGCSGSLVETKLYYPGQPTAICSQDSMMAYKFTISQFLRRLFQGHSGPSKILLH